VGEGVKKERTSEGEESEGRKEERKEGRKEGTTTTAWRVSRLVMIRFPARPSWRFIGVVFLKQISLLKLCV
jgi:hypothetical protein